MHPPEHLIIVVESVRNEILHKYQVEYEYQYQGHAGYNYHED